MSRLCLTAEGPTEQTFAHDVLRPHLVSFGVYLAKGRLTATGRKKGRVFRGGLFGYDPVKRDICNWLKEDKSADVFFTTMLDLYALPDDFPGTDDARRVADAYQRVSILERALAADVADARFIPYVQLHEFEALLFSDPRAFAAHYRSADRQIKSLESVLAQFGNPELINDGKTTSPSKRVIGVFQGYADAKRTVGPYIAGQIGLDAIRSKCRHFNEWLTRLENLGGRRHA